MNLSGSQELGALFTEALSEIVAKTSGLSLRLLASGPDRSFAGIVSLMQLSWHSSITVFLSADEADARLLCSRMTGIPAQEVTPEEGQDALCELMNMTAGNVKLRLRQAGDMPAHGTPYVIKGKELSLTTKKRVCVVSTTLGNEEILIKLKVMIEEAEHVQKKTQHIL